MKVEHLEFIPVSVPYTHREVSSQVRRDGVSDILVRAVTEDGLVGWGESCSGADLESVLAALRAMEPFVLGRSPWDHEALRAELWHRGTWMFRKQTASFAWAGIDMALWDLCGKSCGEPLYNLLGGKVRNAATYFYYLARGTPEELERQCSEGLSRGYEVFYLKVGIDIGAEIEMVRVLRDVLGPEPRIRLDANAAWAVNDALRNLDRLDAYGIDFIEQPVSPDPVSNMQEVRRATRVALCANEGMWSSEDAFRQITSRTADVYCFSPYWVGSLVQFQRLCFVAAQEGLQVCKHTHGELGIAAAAAHHAILTVPNLVAGNQQTAQIMQDDVLRTRLPISDGPSWGVPDGPGIGIEIDASKLQKYRAAYDESGQFLPYDPAFVGKDL